MSPSQEDDMNNYNEFFGLLGMALLITLAALA